jgi:transcriptional regulator with XRE-family HTH domain
MEPAKTIAQLCEQHGLDVKQLAAKCGLEESRVLAIVLGRWLPSPAERDAVAAVFNRKREELVWGHTTPVQHIYGAGPA